MLLVVSLTEITTDIVYASNAPAALTPYAIILMLANAFILFGLGIGGLIVLRFPALLIPVSICHGMVLTLCGFGILEGIGRFLSEYQESDWSALQTLVFYSASAVVCSLSIASAGVVGRTAGY